MFFSPRYTVNHTAVCYHSVASCVHSLAEISYKLRHHTIRNPVSKMMRKGHDSTREDRILILRQQVLTGWFHICHND